MLCVGDSNDKTNSISSQIMAVNIPQNFGHMYSSHHRIIKCVDFKPIHYAINLNVASSFIVFSILILFESIKFF